MANITGKADASLIKADAGTYDTGSNVKALAAGIQGFGTAFKPVLEEAKAFEARYQQFSDAQPELENMGTYSDFQLGMIDEEYSGITQEWNNLSRRLARDKNDIEAKNRLAQLTGKIKNLDAGQSKLSNIRFGLNPDALSGELSDQFTDAEKTHMRSINFAVSDPDSWDENSMGKKPKIEYVGENSTLQITMGDGTIYGGLDPKNKPIPTPQGMYDEGITAILGLGAGFMEDATSATSLLTAAQAKTKASKAISDLKGSSKQNLDLLFRDLTADDSDITFADEFATGGLDKSFYMDDQTGKPAVYQDKEGNDVPAFDEKGNFQWTKEMSKNFLKEPMNQKENMDRFTTYLGNSFADMHNNEFRARQGAMGKYFMGAGGDLFADKTTVKAAKVSEYTDMFVDNIFSKHDFTKMTRGTVADPGYRGIKEDLKKQFNNTGILVDIDMKAAPKDERETLISIGIGSEEMQFDLSDPADVSKMKQYLQKSDYIQNLQLGPNPEQWKDLSGNNLNLLRQ